MKYFDGDPAADLVVYAFINDTHAPLAELPNNSIVTDLFH